MRNLLVVPIIMLLFGCTNGCNVTPKKSAYTTLATVGIAADNAMKIAADARAAGKINDADWKAISNKRDAFNKSYQLACSAVSYDTNKTASANLVLIKDDLVNLVQQLTKAKK